MKAWLQTVSRCERIRFQRKSKTCTAENRGASLFKYIPCHSQVKGGANNAELHHHRPATFFSVPSSSVLGIPLHGRLEPSPSPDGVVSSSPDGWAAWHERPARHGRRVQGWPAWSWSLLTFPQFPGLVSQPARFLAVLDCCGTLRIIIFHGIIESVLGIYSDFKRLLKSLHLCSLD